MTTIAQVIDRTYRDYLTPPGEQPARFKVGAGGIDSNPATTTLPVDTAMLQPEEQDLIGVGTLIEGGLELFLVEQVTGDPPTSLEVRREMYDTSAAALSAGDYLYLAGDDAKSRKSVFDAVADAITAIYPDLYTIDVSELSGQAGPMELPEDAAEVTDVLYQSGHSWVPVQGWQDFRNFPHTSSGRAIQTRRVTGVPLLVYYRKAPVRPTAESDELADLFIEDSWVKVIEVGAVAQLMANKDLDQATIDFITEALEAQNFQVGQGADIRNSLIQYQNFLMNPLRRQLALQEDDRVVYNRVY